MSSSKSVPDTPRSKCCAKTIGMLALETSYNGILCNHNYTSPDDNAGYHNRNRTLNAKTPSPYTLPSPLVDGDPPPSIPSPPSNPGEGEGEGAGLNATFGLLLNTLS